MCALKRETEEGKKREKGRKRGGGRETEREREGKGSDDEGKCVFVRARVCTCFHMSNRCL